MDVVNLVFRRDFSLSFRGQIVDIINFRIIAATASLRSWRHWIYWDIRIVHERWRNYRQCQKFQIFKCTKFPSDPLSITGLHWPLTISICTRLIFGFPLWYHHSSSIPAHHNILCFISHGDFPETDQKFQASKSIIYKTFYSHITGLGEIVIRSR